MGKKSKVGKARKDKFYRLAKETGYRSRAAFKLIQLNRKFEFLEKARVVVDLCAAPGGWLQVAAENTPISSLVVGVDLVSIRPIQRCTTFQADITTEKCKQMLQHELKTWKADVFLNDGAPNVGKNWIHDAYQQAELTLYAAKLATEFLKKGGWFVTKVFRSKDYYSLLWVLQQLFSNVHATKPQASRNESAEIFVVCQGFLAPDKIDPKFLNPKHVFKEVEQNSKQLLDLVHPEKKKRHREGYADGDYTLYHRLMATQFLAADNFLELLAGANEVVLDDKRIADHKLTTGELKECLQDIKVLGKKDIKDVITWRKKLREQLNMADQTLEEAEEDVTTKTRGDSQEEDGEDEEMDVENQLEQMQSEERRTLKRKLKKIRREKVKLRHRMDMKMDIANDDPDITDDIDLFNLKKIKNKKHLEGVDKGDQGLDDEEEELEWEEDLVPPSAKRRTISYDRDTHDYLDRDEVSDNEYNSDPDIEDEDTTQLGNGLELDEENNPLVVDLQRSEIKKHSKINAWFSKSSFADVEDDADEDVEIEQIADSYRNRGGHITGKVKTSIKVSECEGGDEKVGKEEKSEGGDSDSDSSSDSDSDYDTNELQVTGSKTSSTSKKDGFDIVSSSGTGKRLDAVGMAIGAALVQSRKRRREIIDNAYHRYTFDDDGLPDWFLKDEKKHSRIQLPVTKGDIQEYRDKQKAINAKPIRKIAEAKARKKKKEVKRLERARKKAEVVSETTEVSDREKWQQIKQIYKRAGLLGQKKKEISYVVAKKGMGKRVRRPAGVSGPYRVVDKRLKKDKRADNRKRDSQKGSKKHKQKSNKSKR